MTKLQGFSYIPGALHPQAQMALMVEIRSILAVAPLYAPAMPRTGKLMSVRMSNCGSLGWVTDKATGYRYEARHPVSGCPWPPIPASLLEIWSQYAAYDAPPEACLINYYGPGARLGSHRDEDEADREAPVVSVSLGDDAVFHVGGLRRTDPKARFTLRSGDIVVLGGIARMAYHGVDKIVAGTSSLLAEGGRFNLTLRRVTRPDARKV